MASKHSVEGFEAFKAKVEELSKDGKDVFVQFSGAKDADGKSWCPDCVSADPVVQDCVAKLPSDAHFLYVSVGDRATWKDANCVFRTAKETRLTSVPTLMKWGTPNRLEEGDCSNANLVSMLFLED